MNKNLNKDPYDLKTGDLVLLQKFFSSKHLEFTDEHKELVGKLATFNGFSGYRDRQAEILIFIGSNLHKIVWRTESLKYVKQHNKDEVEEMIGYGTIEKDRTITINGTTSQVGIIPTPDNPQIILYGRVEVCEKQVCKADANSNCECLEEGIPGYGQLTKPLINNGNSNIWSEAYKSWDNRLGNNIPSSKANTEANFGTINIDKNEAVRILQDPTKFISELEDAVHKSIIYPNFDTLVDVTNPYDVLKELIRLKDFFNAVPSKGFPYIIAFEENNTGHKITVVKLKNFTRSMFTFNSEKQAQIFLSKYGEYLKLISKVFYNN